MSLPETIRQYFTDDALNQISLVLSEPPQQVRAALSGAVPVLLQLYTDKAAYPDGAEQVFSAMHHRGPSLLDNLSNALSRERAHEFADTGQQQLQRIFPRPALDGLSQAVSRFSGIGVSSSRTLLGIVNSVTLATLAKHISADDGQDVALYLNDHIPAVEAAIPSGLHEHLDASPALRQATTRHYDTGVSTTANDLAMHNESALPRQENAHNERYYAKDKSDGVPGTLAWVVPLIVIVVIGAALLFTISPGRDGGQTPPVVVAPAGDVADPGAQTAQPAAATVRPVSPFAQLRTPADPDIPQQLEAAVNGLLVALPSRDERVHRELEQVRVQLDALSPRIERLPEAQRRDVASSVQNVLPSIRGAAPQVADEGRPAIDQVMRQLERLAAGQPTTPVAPQPVAPQPVAP